MKSMEGNEESKGFISWNQFLDYFDKYIELPVQNKEEKVKNISIIVDVDKSQQLDEEIIDLSETYLNILL